MKKIFILFTMGFFVSCISNQKKESFQEPSAICQINPANGTSVHGEVEFFQKNNKVIINVEVEGLSYGLHAIHIHEFGDCSSFDAKSAGGHWNPNNKKHGEWGSESHHKGDIANLFADSSGNSSLKFETDLWCLGCKDESYNILGKSIIIHQGLDDFHSQPSGNAGKRIGCGIISSVL